MRERGRRHHVPAAYIGHFSPDPNLGNLRRSKIAVHRFDPPADFESVPENVEFFPGAYRVIPWVADPGVSIQKGSSSLAVHALRPVDRLRESSSHDFPAGEWAKVAAFIASLFVPYPVLDAALTNAPKTCVFPATWPTSVTPETSNA